MASVRALIIAEACNPEWVSVPLVGWSHYQALSRVASTHLVTQIRNRPALITAGLEEGRDFTAIDSERVAGPAHKIGEKLRGGKGRGWTTKMLFNLFGRKYFEKLLWKQLGPRITGRDFDVVHQITPLSPTLPAKIATRCRRAGVPFVWGPINGGLPWPPGFAKALAAEREWLSYVRGLHKIMPGYRSTRRDAAAILVGSINTMNQLPASIREKCFYMPENAIDPQRFLVVRQHAAKLPIRCVFLGRLVPYKGAELLLDAAEPLLRAGTITLDFIGDGPQRESLQRRIDDTSLPNTRMLGHVEHNRLNTTLAGYDLLTFPSIREFGGAVVLEAMACGVVPVVVNYGGLGELVTPATGWLVPLGSPAEIVQRLRQTLDSIVAEPSQIDRRSVPAQRRAREQFTWDAKARDTLAVYQWLISGRQKPDFPAPTPDLV